MQYLHSWLLLCNYHFLRRFSLGFGFSPKPLMFSSESQITFRQQRKLQFQVSDFLTWAWEHQRPPTKSGSSGDSWNTASRASSPAWDCLSQLLPSFPSQAEVPVYLFPPVISQCQWLCASCCPALETWVWTLEMWPFVSPVPHEPTEWFGFGNVIFFFFLIFSDQCRGGSLGSQVFEKQN